jgi:hypothetical protein
MHAFGPSPLLMAAKPALLRPAQTFTAPDPFKAVLQGRLVSHLQRSAKSPPPAEMPRVKKLPAAEPRRGADPLAESRISRRFRHSRGGQPGEQSRRLPPERLPEAAGLLLLAGVPPERVQELLSDPKVQEQGLSLADFRQVLAGLPGAEHHPTGGTNRAHGPGAALDKLMPPALSALLELIENSPDEVLPLPPSRQPEIAAHLRGAGLSPAAVEALLTSPRVLDQGLTATEVRAAWLKTVLGEDKAPPEGWQVSAPAHYQALGERLHLPLEALPDLRLALLHLGVSPEALAGLEESATPQGLPLGRVWQLLKAGLHQAQAAPEAGANPGRQVMLDAPPAAQEVEQWRQLLLQSGFSPEAVTVLLGSQTPASVAELRARLAGLAPSAAPPETQDAPKPLYLPEDLRLRSLWWENRSAPEPGFGEGERGPTQGSAGQPWTHNFTPESRGEFSAWLNALAAPTVAPGPGLGGGPLGPLSPEMRQAVWSQLEAGILGNLKPGESRFDLVLEPPHLGRVELTLNLKGEHLAVTAMLTRPEVAHLAGAGVEQLVQALAQQGLILSQFQVQVREGRPDNPGFPGQEARAMGRKEPASGDGEAARRRRTGRVDRFV